MHPLLVERRLKTRSRQLVYSYLTLSLDNSGLFLESLDSVLPSTASVIYHTSLEPFRPQLTTRSAPWTYKEACLRPLTN